MLTVAVSGRTAHRQIWQGQVQDRVSVLVICRVKAAIAGRHKHGVVKDDQACTTQVSDLLQILMQHHLLVSKARRAAPLGRCHHHFLPIFCVGSHGCFAGIFLLTAMLCSAHAISGDALA